MFLHLLCIPPNSVVSLLQWSLEVRTNSSFDIVSLPLGESRTEVIKAKQLLERLNRAKLVKMYEASLTAKAKYPVTNFVSTYRLSTSPKSFVNKLSFVSIPSKV